MLFAALGLALLMGGWIAATPIFDGPDEPDHYLRALSIANGHLLGPKVQLVDAPPFPVLRAWLAPDTRGVLVPARLSPPNFICQDRKLDVGRASCIEATHTGDYPPLPYLLPALAIHAASRVNPAAWLARSASALACAAFVVLALALLWDGSGWSLLGLLAAIPPLVLFVGSVINPNGLEICADGAFVAGIMRITRPSARSLRWVYVALGSSGVVTALSWQLGPVFVLFDVALLAAMLGRAGLRDMYLGHRSQVKNVGLALLAAFAVYLLYGLKSGLLHGTLAIGGIGHGRHNAFFQLGVVLEQSVGGFGSRTASLASALNWIWWAFVVTLLVGGLALGSRRDRSLIVFWTFAGLAFPVLFYAWSYRYTGYRLQGRHMLPALIMLPMLAGEVVNRRQACVPQALRRWLPAGVLASVAAFQLYVWFETARTEAGGPNTLWFLSGATWNPPLGWLPWVGLALLGTASLLAAAAAMARRGAVPGELSYVSTCATTMS